MSLKKYFRNFIDIIIKCASNSIIAYDNIKQKRHLIQKSKHYHMPIDTQIYSIQQEYAERKHRY